MNPILQRQTKLPLDNESYHSAPDRGAEYCDERVCGVRVFVCLSVIIASELHVRSSANFRAR